MVGLNYTVEGELWLCEREAYKSLKELTHILFYIRQDKVANESVTDRCCHVKAC